MVGLPYMPVATLPTAVAFLAYLEARTDLTHDLRAIASFLLTHIICYRLESTGKLNSFYQLESNAKSPKLADKTFIIFEGKHYTYKESYENALRCGAWLRDRFEVRKDEIVALDFLNKPAFVWFWFGLWSIGAKAAFLNYNLGGDALVQSIKTSRARVVIVDNEVAADVFKGEEGQRTLDRVRKELSDAEKQENMCNEREVVVFDEGVERVVSTWAPTRLDDEDIGARKTGEMGLLIFTSGTTGAPKAANVSYTKFVRGSNFILRYSRMVPNDIYYTCMPLYHTAAAIILGASLFTGCTLSLGKKFSHRTFWPEVRESKATIIQYVGETCRYLLSAPPSPLDKQHNVRMAYGNGLRPEVWERFRERFNIPIIVEFYTATEGVLGTWNYNTGPHGSGAVGRCGALMRLISPEIWRIVKFDFVTESPIRDPQTGLCTPTKPGKAGELMWKLNPADIQQSYQGYFENQKATEEKILRDVFTKGDAWVRAGDILCQDKDGYTYFVDRIGDTYRWKSENISTNEIAEIFCKFRDGSDFDQVVAYGVSVPGHDGRAGCIALVPAEGVHPNERWFAELSSFVSRSFPGFKVPRFVRVVKGGRKLEITGTYKFIKAGLRNEGVAPEIVEKTGDEVWFWKTAKHEHEREQDGEETEEGKGEDCEHKDEQGSYKRLRKKEWDELVGGKLKL